MPAEIDLLLRQVPDQPQNVLAALQQNPSLASAQDTNGYSLLHAAASYNQLDLARALVNDYKVDINIKDTENETPLFAAETRLVAQCLVEELNADITLRNDEGATAEENALANMDDGEGADWASVADYLERRRTSGNAGSAGDGGAQDLSVDTSSGDLGDAVLSPSEGLHPPPPLPPNVRINMGTMREVPLEDGQAPDPEFRRRIEELASRDDFQTEEGQKELRKLVEEAIGGLGGESDSTKRRRE